MLGVRVNVYGIAVQSSVDKQRIRILPDNDDLFNLFLIFPLTDGEEIRPEALYVKGVDDMSTQDVFSYFQEYDPSFIEWVNDSSCKYYLSGATPRLRLVQSLYTAAIFKNGGPDLGTENETLTDQ